jgi:hypothetical protein
LNFFSLTSPFFLFLLIFYFHHVPTRKKKSITKVYKYLSKITPAATAATTSKSASEITPAATTSNETTPAPATTSKSIVTTKSKVQHMKEQYKNFKVPDSYLEQQKDLRHNLDLDDNPSLETDIIVTKLLKLVAVLVAFTLKVCLFPNLVNKF